MRRLAPSELTVNSCVRLLLSAALVASVVGLWSQAVDAKTMQAPGTRVVIDVPDGFTPATRFLGFEHPSGASIVILEVPGSAFPRMKKALTAQMLASRGIMDVKPIKLLTGDTRLGLTGRQGTRIGWFQKVMILIGDPKTTALVTANIPTAAMEAGTVSRDAVIDALKTTALFGSKAPRPERFSLTDPAPLKPAGNFAGDTQIFNETGTLPKAPNATIGKTFVVAGSADKRLIAGDHEAIAMRLLQSVRDLDRLTVSQTDPIEIDGLTGVAQTARANVRVRRAEPQPVLLYHVVLFEPEGGYIRMIGQAPLDTGRAALVDFKRMAASLKRQTR